MSSGEIITSDVAGEKIKLVVQIGKKGDKGNTGDITEALQSLSDDVQANTVITTQNRQQTQLDRQAVAADKDTVAADKGIVATDKATVASDRAIVATDKGIVAADRAIIASDKATVATDKGIVAADKATVAANKAAAALSETNAKTSELEAKGARDSAFIQAGGYATEALGRAAVADGQYFKVYGTGEIAYYEYRRINSGSSELITSVPSSEAIGTTSEINYLGIPVTGESRVGSTNAVYASTFTTSDDAYGKKVAVTLSVDQALTHPTFIFPASGDFAIEDTKEVTIFWKLNTLGNNNSGVSVVIGGKNRTTDSYTLFSIARNGTIVRLINTNGAFVSVTNLAVAGAATEITTANIVKFVLQKYLDRLTVRIYRDNTLLLDHLETGLPAIKNIYAALKSSVDASFKFQTKSRKFPDFISTESRLGVTESSIAANASNLSAVTNRVTGLEAMFSKEETTLFTGETLTKLTRSVGVNSEVTTMVLTQSDAAYGKDVEVEVPGSPGNTFYSVIYSTKQYLLSEWDTISYFAKCVEAPLATTGVGFSVVNNRALNGYLEFFAYVSNGSIVTAKIDSVFISTTVIRAATPASAFVLNDEIEIKISKNVSDAYQIQFYKNGVLDYTHLPPTLKAGSEICPGFRSNSHFQIKMRGYLNKWDKIYESFSEGNASPAQESGVRKVEWKFNNATYAPTLITRKTVAPNSINGVVAGNTGLSWDTKRNMFVVSLYNYDSYSGLWLYRMQDLTNYSSSGTITPVPFRKIDLTAFIDHIQGNAYDPILDAYWVIGNKKGVALADTAKVLICFNQDGEPIDYYEFTAYSFQAGMLAYYRDQSTGVESLFIKPNNKTWLLEINKKTKAPIRQPTVFTQFEGLAVNIENGDIWLGDDNGTIKRYNNELVELASYSNQMPGNEVEGMTFIPSINALALNGDAFLHGSNNNGNLMDLYNFTGEYNQKVNLPYTYSWGKGTVGQGLRVNELGHLVGTGVYELPIMDMGSYVDYLTNVLNITQSGKTIAIQYRGSATTPTTTVDNSTTLPIYRSWGATVPGAYQNTVPSNRYVQAKITIS